jgi:hypothetical protein
VGLVIGWLNDILTEGTGMPAKKPSKKASSSNKNAQCSLGVMDANRLDPELAQFLQTFLTSSVIADKLRVIEAGSKNQMASIIKKVDEYEKAATESERALFDFVTNYGLSEMYNKSLMALILNFTMNGMANSTEMAKQVEMMLRPITLPENRQRTAYIFKEWLIDHAQDSVKKIARKK